MWWTILLQPGSVLRDNANNSHCVILKTTQFYALAWRAQLVNVQERVLSWTPLTSDWKQCRMLVQLPNIGDNFKIMRTKGVSPARASKVLTCANKFQLCYKLDGAAMSVGLAAARAGFRNTTMRFLEKLYRSLEHPEGTHMALTEMALVQQLVRHYIPDITDDEMKEILAKRGKSQRTIESALDDEANVELAGEVLEEDEMDVLEKEQARKAKKLGGAHPGEGGGAASSSTGLKSRGAFREDDPRVHAYGVLPRDVGDESLSLEWARQFAPEVKGCKMDIDTTDFYRWKLTYVVGDHSRMHTKSWNNVEVTRLSALVDVLQWAWAQHFLATGQKCPYNLDLLPEIVLHGAAD
jgi:hypothetical protein